MTKIQFYSPIFSFLRQDTAYSFSDLLPDLSPVLIDSSQTPPRRLFHRDQGHAPKNRWFPALRSQPPDSSTRHLHKLSLIHIYMCIRDSLQTHRPLQIM